MQIKKKKTKRDVYHFTVPDKDYPRIPFTGDKLSGG